MTVSFDNQEEFLEKIRKSFSFSGIKPSLRVCVTEKCNFNCEYCHREGMQKKFLEYLTIEDYEFIARVFSDLDLEKVKFTGGEPLLRDDLPQIVKVFKKADFKDISLTTNGSLITKQNLQSLKEAGLGRVTISFDSLKKRVSKQINNCECLERVLQNVSLAKEFFNEVKINCVLLPTVNFPDEILEITNFCRDQGVTLKFLSKLSEDAPYPLSSQALSIIKLHKHLNRKETNPKSFVPTTKYYFSDGTTIEVSDFRNKEYRKRVSDFPQCENCPLKEKCVEGPYAIRIMPNGDIKPCLIREDNIIRFRKIKPSQVKLICLTGLASSGKSSFREIAQEKFGIRNIYIGKILKDELDLRKTPITYENVMNVSKKIYSEEGPLGTMKRSFKAIQNNLSNEKIILLDSVRSVEEYNFLKQFFKTYLIGVICNKTERYKRARQGDFKLTKAQLVERDKLEMGELRERPLFNVGELLGNADYYISGESKKFKEDAGQIIKEILDDRS